MAFKSGKTDSIRPESADGHGKSANAMPAANDASVLPQSGYLTADYVKRRYSISNSTVYQWLANTRRGVGNGFPAPVKIGPRAVRWTAESLRAFEAALQAGE